MSDRHGNRIKIEHQKVYKSLGLFVLGLLFMPMLPLLLPSSTATIATNLEDTEFQLSVIPVAPKLPADRNSYYVMIQLQVVDNNDPIEAPEDMAINLLSSDPSVISLPVGKVTLMQGESMVKVAIDSTDKAGIASITAQSEGVRSSTASITTYRMDSLEPTRLAIYAAPSSFIPDPQYVGKLYIQVLNSQSLPAVSKNDISIDISSSDFTVGKVPSYAVIPAGSSGITVDFIPQKQSGQTTVKASAPGLAPGELLVDVSGSVASKLVVEFAPNVVPAINYNDALMTVQLADESDRPVKASKITRVSLRSSDTSVIQVPQYVEIPAGKSHVSTFVVAKGSNGTATVTASATGFATGINSIDAVGISTAGTNDPKQLQIFSVPSILPPDNSEHKSIVVAFQDMEGKPFRQFTYYFQRIALSTSDTKVGDITSGLLAKETYAIATFKTKYAVGETEITASLEGYHPAQMNLMVSGAGPAAVSLTQIPEIIEANNFDSQSLVVSLVDHDGMPVAAQQDTAVYLSSSDPEITRIASSIVIPAGKSYATASAHSTLRAGTTIITGSADGLGAGSAPFRTVGFTGSVSEYHLGLYPIPKLSADGREHEAIVVQLQDRAGLPVLAKSDVPVSLSSGSLTAGSIQANTVIPEGSNLVTAIFNSSLSKTDPFKITASSEGFTTVEGTMETTTQPLTILKSSEFSSRADFGAEIPVSVEIYSGNIPVRDATVMISGANAEDSTVMTDPSGHAEGLYKPTLPGSNSIVITATKPGYEPESISSRIILAQTVDVKISSRTVDGATVPVQLKVSVPSGVKVQTAKLGIPITYDNVNWGSYTVTATPQVKTSNAVYDFVGWSDGATANPRTWVISEDAELTAVYNAQYLLQTVDINGLTEGGRYYNEGETASVSIKASTVPGIMIDKEFAGWSGDVKSASPSVDVLMDGPKTIEAQWKDNYLKVGLVAVAIGGGGFLYYWKIFKPKKELEEKQRAPDLDWYKS